MEEAADDQPSYEVALSFAGEDRPFVGQVASALQRAGVAVFYDEYEKATLWGKDLYVHLSNVYRRASRYTVMFASKHYAMKVWPNHERRNAQARALEERREYILPARFDDTEIPGLLPTTGYVDLRTTSPSDLAMLVLEKLGRSASLQDVVRRSQASILALLVKTQSTKVPLAECVAEGLVLARACGDADLAAFCTNELVGYSTESTDAERASRPFRHMKTYCTLGELNLPAIGFQGMTVMSAVAQHPEKFFERAIVLTEPIAVLEAKETPKDGRGSWHITLHVRDFNPSAEAGDIPVNCYSPPRAYQDVVMAVRTELTRRLAALLTTTPSPTE